MSKLRTLFPAFCFSLCLMATGVASAADGPVSIKSPYPVRETMTRLEDLVKERGLTVFARVDHAAGAAKIGMALRANEVLIFGNPQSGTPFLECAQTLGIELPLKALVWPCRRSDDEMTPR